MSSIALMISTNPFSTSGSLIGRIRTATYIEKVEYKIGDGNICEGELKRNYLVVFLNRWLSFCSPTHMFIASLDYQKYTCVGEQKVNYLLRNIIERKIIVLKYSFAGVIIAPNALMFIFYNLLHNRFEVIFLVFDPRDCQDFTNKKNFYCIISTIYFLISFLGVKDLFCFKAKAVWRSLFLYIALHIEYSTKSNKNSLLQCCFLPILPTGSEVIL